MDSVHRQLTFLKKTETLAAKTLVQEILDDVREVLMETDMKRLSKGERDRLKELVRVMVKK